MIIKRAFKFKLTPRTAQREKFSQFAGARRFVFNRGLHQRQTTATTGKNLSYFEQNKELTTLKQTEETSWLKEIHSQVLQQDCGTKNDRDYNSAIVLKTVGMLVLKACGAALIEGSVEAGISRL